jgi:hypothetical protein
MAACPACSHRSATALASSFRAKARFTPAINSAIANGLRNMRAVPSTSSKAALSA